MDDTTDKYNIHDPRQIQYKCYQMYREKMSRDTNEFSETSKRYESSH